MCFTELFVCGMCDLKLLYSHGQFVHFYSTIVIKYPVYSRRSDKLSVCIGKQSILISQQRVMNAKKECKDTFSASEALTVFRLGD